MAIGLPVALRNARLNEIRTAIDAGAGAGKVRIYDGTRPGTGGTATTLLAELDLSDPSSEVAAAGVLTLSAITDDSSADANGTATWFRIVDSDANFVCDGDVATSGAELNLNSVDLVLGGIVSISSFVLTEGNA